MARKLHKLFMGAAVLSIGISSCLAMAPAANAGEIPLSGVLGWGQNLNGSLGIGTSSITPTPAVSAGKIPNVVKLATSSTHTLFLDNEGNVYASGDNSRGQLGTGNITSSSIPVKVTLPKRFGVPDYATQVWTGAGVSFMRGSYGDVYSWGSNDKGRTGLGKTSGNTLIPTKVSGVSLGSDDKETLSVSSTAVGIISSDPEQFNSSAQLYTWGENTSGVLGRPSSATSPVVASPQRVLIPDPEEEKTKFVDVCSIVKDPDTGTSQEECTSVETAKEYDDYIGLSPERVAVGKNFFVTVSGSAIHTWGFNDKGQLGMNLPTSTIKATPTTSAALILEQFASVASLAAGEDHVILLGSDGLVYGWGDNSKSQVAPYYAGSTGKSYLPVLQRLTIKKEVSDSSSWAYVETGDDSSYAVTSDNDAYGWGDNSSGEMAHTKAAIVYSPERITFPNETEVFSFVAGGNNAIAISDYTIEYPDVSVATTVTSLPRATGYTDYSYTLKSAGGYPDKKHTWTVYGLPKGLSFDSNTGRVFGQATEVGTFDVEAMVTDNVAEANKSFTLVVAKAAPTVAVTYSNVAPGTNRATINVMAGTKAASGTATLTYGTATKTVTLSSGKATVDFTGTLGSTVTASVKYNGSETMNTSSSAATSVVITPKYATTTTATYKSNNPGQITATINVAQGTTQGTGAVTFQYGSVKQTANLVNGTAVITVNAIAGTKYAVSASYAGSATVASSATATTSITTMNKRAPIVSTTYVSGKPGEISAAISVKDGTANGTGTVTLYVGTLTKTATLVNGKAVITIAATSGTAYSVKTTYSGSTNLNTKTTPSVSVTTKVKYNSKPVVTYKVVGRTVTATVSVPVVSGLTPRGTVYLYDGSTKIKTLTLSSTGTVSTSVTLPVGTHKLKAVYAGSTYFNTYTSSVTSVMVK